MLGKMILTVDTSIAAIYRDGSLINVVTDFWGARAPRDLVMDRQVEVRTGSGRQWSGVKTIRGLEPMVGEFQFTNSNDELMTVKDYFLQFYNLRIEHSRIISICLSGRSGCDDVVPLELCRVLPGQLYKKKLPGELTKEMVMFSSVRPHDCQRMIQAKALNFRSEFIVESGMELDKHLLTVNAKVLRMPGIKFHPEQRTLGNAPLFLARSVPQTPSVVLAPDTLATLHPVHWQNSGHRSNPGHRSSEFPVRPPRTHDRSFLV
ncbi:hypothetical protein M413DRAFT_32663 [Hebeloma cylindrosporum]|uniref:PAZ domain-containing protein n=1 Tax=Hebeloma cylindrosporum TaxID=76867 RepID=A0A0C3BT04_HEBCY|nr:hypothetical protein M413DRAFT_32663 [Hebeloma cylindrosporum h7]